MSTPTKIQSSAVPLMFSEDNITYKNAVCKRSFNFNGDTTTNVEEDDCGTSVGLGATNWTVDFEGTVNTTPTSTTELSAADLFNYWQNKTLLYIKYLTGAGNGKNLYRQGAGYVTAYTESGSVGNLVTYTLTFTGDGAIDSTV